MKSNILKYIILGLFGLFQLNSAEAQNFDTKLLQSINSPATKNDKFWLGVTHSSIPIYVATPLVMYGYGLINDKQNDRINAVIQVEALALNTLITMGLKWSVRRERPFVNNPLIYKKTDVGPFSFPSGHTSIAFASATSLTLAYPKWYVAVPAFTLAACVGYSRSYLGVHYPSDVFIGALVGSLSSFIIFKANQHLLK